jgi:hypothetical protein
MPLDSSNPISNRARLYRAPFDLSDFVNEVADRFQLVKRGRIRISPAAREELIRAMKPHEKELFADLSTGKMTPEKLTIIMAGVLNAASVLQRSNPRYKARIFGPKYGPESRPVPITRQNIRVAMKFKCRYLGWC